MTTSALLHEGLKLAPVLLEGVQSWMVEHEYESIQQMKGSMSQRAVADPSTYERANYMTVLSSY
jgi:dihydroorotate dehydrogenase (fumarate)